MAAMNVNFFAGSPPTLLRRWYRATAVPCVGDKWIRDKKVYWVRSVEWLDSISDVEVNVFLEEANTP